MARWSVRFTLSSILLIAAFAAGCSSSSISVLPTSASTERCGVTLTVSKSSITSAGGSGTVSVATARECQWTLSSESDWLTFSVPTAGQGPADLTFSVQPNRSTSSRSVAVSIGDQRATISQQAATCPWNVAPSEIVADSAGGDHALSLTTEDFCSWVVISRDSWLGVASASNGKGSADIVLRIAPNHGPERTSSIEVAGATVSVRQRGTMPPDGVPPQLPSTPSPTPTCTYNINPSSYTSSYTGGTVSVNVTTTAGCSWTVMGNPTWVSPNPNNRAGSGTTVITVQANDGAARSSAFQIAGRDFVAQQGSAPCTYLHGPTSRSIPASPTTTREIGVQTQPYCPVAATVNVSWIEIMYAPTFGSGEVGIRILENTGAPRSGIVTVTGENFIHMVTINQDGTH